MWGNQGSRAKWYEDPVSKTPREMGRHQDDVSLRDRKGPHRPFYGPLLADKAVNERGCGHLLVLTSTGRREMGLRVRQRSSLRVQGFRKKITGHFLMVSEECCALLGMRNQHLIGAGTQAEEWQKATECTYDPALPIVQ